MKKAIFGSYALLWTLSVCMIGCSNEKDVRMAMPAARVDTITTNTSSAVEKTLTVQATVSNNGLTSTANIIGNGEIRITNVDIEGNETVQPYTIAANATATVTAEKDTVVVESFGAECIGYPESTTTDANTETSNGKKTTMESWKFSDGQITTGIMAYAYDYVATELAIPHVIVENLRFNKLYVEKLSDNAAKVTQSYLVDYRSVEANSNPSGTLEMLMEYTQVIPAKEEPKGPTYTWVLNFTLQEGKNNKPNKLVAEMAVNSSEGGSWSYSWYAAQCGKFNDLQTLYVASTEVTGKVQESKDYPDGAETSSFEKDGALWNVARACQRTDDFRYWKSNGGGNVGPEMSVFFYTTGVEFTAPTGEKIKVSLIPTTTFGNDEFLTDETLVGDVKNLPNESTQYLYAKSYRYTADHYVACTVVDIDGSSKAVSIDCLQSGMFLHNACTTNLYLKK